MLNPTKTAEHILASLAEPVLVLDSGLRAVFANPAFYQTLQIGPEALVGKEVQELIVDERGPPQLKAVLSKVIEHGGDLEGAEILCTIPPHAETVLHINARRLRPAPDVPDWIVVECHDITDAAEVARKVGVLHEMLERHSADLEYMNQELDSFAHSVSHDLRTPLRFTNKVAHKLLEDHGAGLPAGAADLVKMIMANTDEMAKLIESLLAFSSANREPLRKKPIDMKRLVQEAVDDLRDEQQGRNLKIVVDELTPCEADRTLLKLAILNLLENALKFTRECEAAEIHFGCVQTADKTVYFVRDNGLGFDANQAESMFIVFQRLHRSHRIEGSGVGLALVRRIIERHGGRIWAEGEPQRGATFYFTLDVEYPPDERTTTIQ